MKMSKICCFTLLALSFLVSWFIGISDAQERTYVSFLEELIDLKALAKLPSEGETCKQFSSYDRRSRYDAEKDKYINWGANGDAGNFLREDPEGRVLAEMDGPGCIYRIWSANPRGVLKVFLDRAKEPAIQVSFPDLINGKMKPVASPLVGLHARGANCYLPIPYQKHCRVVVEKPGRMYFHVNYRTFPKGTKVATFKWPLGKEAEAKLAEVLEVLRNCGPADFGADSGAKKENVDATIEPGKNVNLAEIAGRRAIVGITLKLKGDGLSLKKQRLRLRGLTMEAYWDGEDAPSIWGPLGDLFGTAPGPNVYRSLPLGITKDGQMYMRWYMPFQRSARIVLRNDWDSPVELDAVVWHESHDIAASETAYCHAKWRREYPNRVFDWPFLECSGRGRYVGVMLSVWNPIRGWWGEGDEKIFVDGEKFPSTFGTGSEDYFGYAWCNTTLFANAFHNQTLCEGPGNGNYTSVNRWHIGDNIPFQKSIRVTIENYGKNRDYACTTYWYAAHPQKDFFKPLPMTARALHEPFKPFKRKGAIEGESLKVLAKEGPGPISHQGMGVFGNNWSDDGQIWYRPRNKGEWVELGVQVKKAGTYRVIFYFTKARDYGIAQLSINGQKVGEPYDAFNSPRVIHSGPVDMGVVKLEAGQARLRIDIIGKNEKSVGYMFGIDCLELKPE